VEPTSCALLAIGGIHEGHGLAQQTHAAIEFLRRTKLQDGSWPNAAGGENGGWVTSLACLALAATTHTAIPEVDAGLHWLCSSWPGEGGMWWRIRHRLSGQSHLVGQDHRLRGWSWTQGTSSWVEPTACALLALRHARGSESFPAHVEKRCNLAQQMLCNRMCHGGGWNCGNPLVYGAAGSPLIGPTCWALFALGDLAQSQESRRCIRESLAWLERAYLQAQGPASLALAHLCLKAFGRNPHAVDSRLAKMYDQNRFLGDIQALAWAALTARPVPRWLLPAGARNN
jgi:hypothetical protein